MVSSILTPVTDSEYNENIAPISCLESINAKKRNNKKLHGWYIQFP